MWPDGLAPHVDSLSSRVQLDPKVVDTLLDVVDGNEDGRINYAEFSDVVMEGAVA